MIRYIHGYSDASRKASRYLQSDPSILSTAGYPGEYFGSEISKQYEKLKSLGKRLKRLIYRGRLNFPEQRRDICIWRSGIASNRFVAYRYCLSNRVKVNGICKIPSFYLTPGDFVSLDIDILTSNYVSSPSSFEPLVASSFCVFNPDFSDFSTSTFPFNLLVDLPSNSFVYMYDPTLLPKHPIIYKTPLL